MSKQTFFQNLIEECNMECNTHGKMISDNMGELLAQKFAETFDNFGYPYIGKIYTPLMFEHEYEFRIADGINQTLIELNPVPVVGQTYRVLFDGEQYECVCVSLTNGNPGIGNFKGMGLEDTGEPFAIMAFNIGIAYFMSYDTATAHTICVSLVTKTVTPMAEDFMPVLTSPNGTKYKLTVDDTGALSTTEVST